MSSSDHLRRNMVWRIFYKSVSPQTFIYLWLGRKIVSSAYFFALVNVVVPVKNEYQKSNAYTTKDVLSIFFFFIVNINFVSFPRPPIHVTRTTKSKSSVENKILVGISRRFKSEILFVTRGQTGPAATTLKNQSRISVAVVIAVHPRPPKMSCRLF